MGYLWQTALSQAKTSQNYTFNPRGTHTPLCTQRYKREVKEGNTSPNGGYNPKNCVPATSKALLRSGWPGTIEEPVRYLTSRGAWITCGHSPDDCHHHYHEGNAQPAKLVPGMAITPILPLSLSLVREQTRLEPTVRSACRKFARGATFGLYRWNARGAFTNNSRRRSSNDRRRGDSSNRQRGSSSSESGALRYHMCTYR